MKTKLITLLLCSLLLSGCGNAEGGLVDPHGPVDPSETYKVDFSKYNLGGVEQIQSSDPTFKTKMLSYINSSCSNQAESFECTENNRVRLVNNSFPGDFGSAQGLVLASQNYDGEITIKFAKEIKSVIVKAQQYYNLTSGYQEDTHIYPTYDSQKWDEETSEYVPDEPTLEINEQVMSSLINITYSYDDYGYTIPVVPPICEQKFDINSETLSVTAFASQRVRIYELSFEF